MVSRENSILWWEFLYFANYEGLFKEDASSLDDKSKDRLLLRKINEISHEKYLCIILPKQPSDFTFEENVKKLEEIFKRKKSRIHHGYDCLQLTRLTNKIL